MKDKLRDAAQILARIFVGIPIMAVIVLVVRLLVYLATLTAAHPIAALYILTVVAGLSASYIVGNVTVKKWRRHKIRKKVNKDSYD